MTLFGWIYLIMTVLGAIIIVNDIGRPRKPRTAIDVTCQLLVSGFLFYGLYVWGLR